MKTYICKWILAAFLLLPLIGVGQTRKISGTVVSFDRYPLKNINIQAKKAKSETMTNEEGKFELEVKKNDVIQIKESVFAEYKVKVKDDTDSLRINLIYENTGDNMEIATESGFISREDLEFGLENLYRENSVYGNFTDVYQAVKYALPETSIIVEDGHKAIQFRGPKTIEGSNAALFLVDGVIVEDISFINPVEIISISKLGSNAASLYGARAANGVIAIQTR